MLSSDYYVLRSTVIALNNFIQYKYCQVVQPFGSPLLIKALTTIISKQAFLVEMTFSMTANVKYTIEQWRLLRNSRCLSAGSDSVHLQFKPIIWARSYPRKHTNCITPLQERHFPTPLRHAEKQQLYWKWATFSLESFSLQPPKFNVDKPT